MDLACLIYLIFDATTLGDFTFILPMIVGPLTHKGFRMSNKILWHPLLAYADFFLEKTQYLE